jgi:hypothetical protein
MSDGGSQLSHRCDAIGVCERLPFFFRSTMFGHIDHGAGAGVFSKIPEIVENRMTYDMDVLDSRIGHQQSFLKIKNPPLLSRVIDGFASKVSIEWMSTLKYQLYRRLVSPVWSGGTKNGLSCSSPD